MVCCGILGLWYSVSGFCSLMRHGVARYGVLWCWNGMVWYAVMWYNNVWCRVVEGTVWYGMVLCGILLWLLLWCVVFSMELHVWSGILLLWYQVKFVLPYVGFSDQEQKHRACLGKLV